VHPAATADGKGLDLVQRFATVVERAMAFDLSGPILTACG
jgi:hypothetical protein